MTGSTRLKAGTAQKLVLNMLSTGVMIRLGKTYGNLMVDVQSTNSKLRDRSRRIVMQALGVSAETASALLGNAGGEVKTAIAMELMRTDAATARAALAAASGNLRLALGEAPRA